MRDHWPSWRWFTPRLVAIVAIFFSSCRLRFSDGLHLSEQNRVLIMSILYSLKRPLSLLFSRSFLINFHFLLLLLFIDILCILREQLHLKNSFIHDFQLLFENFFISLRIPLIVHRIHDPHRVLIEFVNDFGSLLLFFQFSISCLEQLSIGHAVVSDILESV